MGTMHGDRHRLFYGRFRQYRLLARGIVVHHGKMPGLLARRLKTVIDRGYVRVIIATSTLSEGVNIPVNFLLIPSVFRSNGELPLQEFSNLIGRAGRPGVATEGSALVVLPERTYEKRFGRIVPTYDRQWNGYESLVAQLEAATAAVGDLIPDDQASSPLAHLLRELERTWKAVVGGGTEAEFIAWLEQTAVTEQASYPPSSHDYLDSLDAFLIAAIGRSRNSRVSNSTLPSLNGNWPRFGDAPMPMRLRMVRRIWRRSGWPVAERSRPTIPIPISADVCIKRA